MSFNIRTHATVIFALALALLVLLPATANAIGLKRICALHNQAAKTITLVVSNGCVSGSRKFAGSDIEFRLDRGAAAIHVTGEFAYLPLTPGQAVRRDCSGRRQQSFALQDAEKRAYRVFVGGKYRGVFDFSALQRQTCINFR